LLSAGFAAGCGEDAATTETTETSAALRISNSASIEGFVQQRVIVSEQGDTNDPPDNSGKNLLNAWGLVFSPKGEAWISSNGKETLVAYDENGNLLHTISTTTAKGLDLGAPTGVVWNSDRDGFRGDRLIFVTEDGFVGGADPAGTNAKKRFSEDNAIYKGCALASSHGKTRLYLADFGNGQIEVLDEHYRDVKTRGAFIDPGLKDETQHFVPFNVMTAGDRVFVAYAVKQNEGDRDEQAGPGNGIVDLFDTDGNFLDRLVSHAELDSPWGLALGPDRDDRRASDLLVGNFGHVVDSENSINVYELSSAGGHVHARFEGALGDNGTGQPIVIEGLWGIVFGNGLNGFETDELYVTAGPNDEADGLFSELSFVSQRH